MTYYAAETFKRDDHHGGPVLQPVQSVRENDTSIEDEVTQVLVHLKQRDGHALTCS